MCVGLQPKILFVKCFTDVNMHIAKTMHKMYYYAVMCNYIKIAFLQCFTSEPKAAANHTKQHSAQHSEMTNQNIAFLMCCFHFGSKANNLEDQNLE